MRYDNMINRNIRKVRTLRDDVQKKRVKNGTLAQMVGRYQNKIPI